jgi:predicted ATPase
VIVSRLILKNWRNFREFDARFRDRVFLIGPNASGKSNLLDALRFLRDIAKAGGGLQWALEKRLGLSKVRCLAARSQPDVELEVELSNGEHSPVWRYALGITQQVRGYRQPQLRYERVWRDSERLLDRPDKSDKTDPLRLTQTHLEQIGANERFREIARFLESIRYLHLVPQLLRTPPGIQDSLSAEDPYGRNFLDQIAKVSEKTRKARLKRIGNALKVAVPQLKDLTDTRDKSGVPHLQALYEHWRPNAGWQQEDQFSDGTLRLIGLLWSLLDGDSTLLLEEPELSLNREITAKLPALFSRLQRQKARQIILTTHSWDLLSDGGIGGEEVVILAPSPDGTRAQVASQNDEVDNLLRHGLSVADAALPRVAPKDLAELNSF